MSETQEFFASGAGNGTAICLSFYSQTEVEAIESENESGNTDVIGIRRFKEVTLNEMFNLFWLLEYVDFPDVPESLGGGPTPVPTAEYRIGDASFEDNIVREPYERICWEKGTDKGVSESVQVVDYYPRFQVFDFAYNTTTESFMVYYSAAFFADDGVGMVLEIPFEDLTFTIYTFP
jgi:hypothetical protein